MNTLNIAIGERPLLEAPVGVHCILELYQCSPALLNDPAYIESAVEQASQQAQSTLLKMFAHQFEPQGVTAIALLAESHLSIHTWPERGYAAVDIFTCGEHTEPQLACEFLARHLGAERHLLSVVSRGGRITKHLPIPVQTESPLCL